MTPRLRTPLKSIRSLVILGLVIILLLVPFALAPAQAQAEPEADAWTRYPIPRKGEEGGWILTGGGTGVTAICVAFDGTIYAATQEIDGSPLDGYNLFKSTDDGYTWTPLWEIPAGDKPSGATAASKVIALLLPRWEETDILYLATQYNVYKSTDGGENFTMLPPNPGGAGSSNVEITSLDVTYYHDNHWVLVGSRDADADGYSGVYFYDESEIFTSWADLRVGNAPAGTRYDVLDVAFSPNFADDMQVVALVTDENDTIVTTKFGNSDWGAAIGDAYLLNPLTETPSSWVATGASLAFPGDYDSSDVEDRYIQYIGLNVDENTGGVFIVTGLEAPDDSLVEPLFAPYAVHSLAATGEILSPTIVAGLTDVTNGGVFYIAGDPTFSLIGELAAGDYVGGGLARTPPAAPPAENVYVTIGGLHGSAYIVYAGTSGANSGFARSVNSGATFAQTAFICDDLQTITDLAVSPNYATDSTMYMITEGNSGNSILWRTTNSGTTWDAVLTSSQIKPPSGASIPEGTFDKVALSPHFKSDTTVFICESGAQPNIWRSTDNGFHFWPLPERPPIPEKEEIDSWAIVNNEEILVGDSLGNFYKTTDDRLIWSSAVATGLSSFSSMALSPDYDDDSTILAGDDDGRIYLSTDDGETWEQPTISDTGLDAGTLVAFSPFYADDKTIYATDSATDTGILRLVIDTDTDWERIDQTNPSRIEEVASNITGLQVVDDGDGLSTLYVTDPNPVVPRVIGTTAAEGGVARCLNPTGPLSPATSAPVFEIVNTDLAAEIELSGLWHAEGSHTLWSIDTASTPMVLYAYEDTLTLSPELASPPDRACSGRETSSEVSWDSIGSASSYNLWYDIFPSFKQSPVQINSEVANTRISGLDIGTTYYWRVRVGEAGDSTCVPGTTITFGAPALSRFSTSWSFTTALGGAQWSPFGTATGVAPPPGATSVPIRPSFAWNSAEGATGYEFVLSRDSEFSDVVIALTDADALSTTVWACSQDLDYDTTYFWRVRAISATGQSLWGVGVFTTGAVPKAPPQPSQPSSSPAPTSLPGIPIYFWVALGIGVALVIVVLVLIVATLRARL